MKRRIIRIILTTAIISAIFMIFSCDDPVNPPESGGTGTVTAAPNLEEEEGYFIDAPAYGLYYKAYPSGICGTTTRSGMFRYRRGDKVTFCVGTLPICNPVMAVRCISPLLIAGATSVYGNSPEAIHARNIIRFLMAMSTGTNPYGLCISSPVGNWGGDLVSVLRSPDFEPKVVDVVAALRGIVPSEVVIPTVEAAQEHFTVSESLVTQLEQNSSKNLYASMKLPAIFKNSYVDVFYNKSEFNTDETSYTSGHKILVGNNRNASFSARLDEGNWQLTLTAMQNNSGISVNDVIAFYTPDGFSSSPSSGYSLRIAAEKEILHADLTDSEKSCVIESVHVLSGAVSGPSVLPDSTDVTDAAGGSLRIFVDILDSEGARAGSIMLMLPVPDGSEMTSEDGYVTIPYTTTLADGYRYKVQIYYKPDTSKSYYVREAYLFEENFSSDVYDLDFAFTEWENQ